MKNGILENNKEAMQSCNLRLQRDYSRLRRCDKKPEKEVTSGGTLKQAFTFNEEKNLDLIAASAIPSIVSITLAGIGAIGVGVSMIALLANLGYESTPQELMTLKKIEDFCANSSKFSCARLEDSIRFLSIPAFIALISTPNAIIKKFKDNKNDKEYNKKMAKYEGRLNEFIKMQEVMQLIEDVNSERQDVSLSFIREFLGNVDLSQNTENFNLELLSKMAEYRVSLLKITNGEASEFDVNDSFNGFVNVLKNASAENGASDEFTNNAYVQGLIYNADEKESVEEHVYKKVK